MPLTDLRKNAIAEVIEREGGSKYTNRAADRGGPTRWGVTEATARRFGYEGDMAQLPYEVAERVYLAIWQECQCDAISELDTDMAVYVFDFAVNSGEGNAGKRLQRLLNVLNNRGRLYPDITVDGDIGPGTVAALKAYAARRGVSGLRLLREAYNALRIGLCFDLAERQEAQEENINGWFSRIVNL